MNRQFRISTILLFLLTQTICFAQTKQQDKKSDAIFTNEPCFIGVEGEIPEFPGGRDSLTNFLKRNIKFPLNWKGDGTVGVKFTVDTSGVIRNVRLMKGLCEECDKEALRVVQLMPTWTPRIDSKTKRPVDTEVNLPIIFRTKK